jgi:hypothetical protein
LGKRIKKSHRRGSGSATFALDADFDGSDCASEIPIRGGGTNVTIHGNGAVLDAAQNGRFFSVSSGATLALDHLTLQHGSVSDDVSADYLPPSVAASPAQTPAPPF